MMINMLTEAAIRSRVGEKSFSRGRQYYEEGAIMSPWVQGDVLKAKCWGSSPHLYRVWAAFHRLALPGDKGYCR